MDFDYSPKTKELQAKLLQFMDDHIYPNEATYSAELAANTAAGKRWSALKTIEDLKPKAQAAGLWNLFLPVDSAAASGYDPTGSYSVGSRYATNMPRHLFKLATSYQLPGALHRWKVGGSVHVQDSISSTWNVRQGGYALVGLHAAYALSRQLDLSLNVNNLFDRSYYSGIGADNGPNFFGDPRNVMLTARYRF